MKRNISITLTIVALLAALFVACQPKVAEVPVVDTGPELAMQSRDNLLSRDGGNAVEIWNGGDIVAYSNEGSTQSVLIEGAQGLAKFTVPTAVGTATPAVLIDNQGSVANSLEVRKNATPVFYVDVDGNVTYTGMTSAGGLISAAVGVSAPTAVATATPAFYVDSLGVSNLFEVRDAATPVAYWANGGALTQVGNTTIQGTLDVTGASTFTGAATINNNLVVTGTSALQGVTTFSAVPVYAGGAGAVVANKATAVETGDGYIHKTVLTLTLSGDHDLDLADGDHGTGIKVYDFPEGRISILGVTMNADAATTGINANPNDTYYVALGSVVGADDADLTGTEADLLAKITADGATTATLHGALAAAAQFDGTTTPLDLYVNAACADASNSAAVTLAITGTVTIHWINLGDY